MLIFLAPRAVFRGEWWFCIGKPGEDEWVASNDCRCRTHLGLEIARKVWYLRRSAREYQCEGDGAWFGRSLNVIVDVAKHAEGDDSNVCGY